MNKKHLKELLIRALDEIQNLEDKVRTGEPAGWEGVRRRAILRLDLAETTKLLSYEVT